MKNNSSLKGFIHIVEIIIISLVMFILVVQFSSIPSIRQDWDRTKLALSGNDLLHSLDATGIDWMDTDEVDQALLDALGGSIRYDVTVRNAIKPEIEVGCICTDTETNLMESVLDSFTLNRQRTEIRASACHPPSPRASSRW